MDYFDDVFHTFLDLDSVIYYVVNGTVTSLPVFIQNILNCVPRTNEAFTGLERHEWLMMEKNNFGVAYPFNVYFLLQLFLSDPMSILLSKGLNFAISVLR